MQTIDGVEYLEVEEAAQRLGVKKATLYAYVSRGLLQSYRHAIGRKRLYRRDAIETLREVRPSGESIHVDENVVREVRPSGASIHVDDDVVRDVSLPDAASWAGEH